MVCMKIDIEKLLDSSILIMILKNALYFLQEVKCKVIRCFLYSIYILRCIYC
jgi:hypothetical protein